MQPVNVEIEEVTQDSVPLTIREAKYKAVHDRIKTLEPGRAFRAKFDGKHTAKNARTSALTFADKAGIQITTSVYGEVLEVMRLKEAVR